PASPWCHDTDVLPRPDRRHVGPARSSARAVPPPRGTGYPRPGRRACGRPDRGIEQGEADAMATDRRWLRVGGYAVNPDRIVAVDLSASFLVAESEEPAWVAGVKVVLDTRPEFDLGRIVSTHEEGGYYTLLLDDRTDEAAAVRAYFTDPPA